MVFGTRPEAIKMAPLVKEFQKYPKLFNLKVCVTAQHRQMVDDVLKFFEIVPDYDLDIMKKDQDLYDVTSNILIAIRDVLSDFTPDIVCVHGDTTTTFATSLGCYYQKIDVAHIEAGLRTFNKYSPFPEEIYRELICKITKYHFAPTLLAKKNLQRDNIEEKNIIITGNTVIDSLFLTIKRVEKSRDIERKLLKIFNKEFDINKKFILVTAHRRENFGDGLRNIASSLKQLATNNQNINIVYPVHLNPDVKDIIFKELSNIENIYLIPPLEYELFIYFMNKSYIILTDSGGVQEEAPSLGKPVLVMRNDTERQEAIEVGTVKLVGTTKENIVKETQKLLLDDNEYKRISKIYNPYGDGNSCKKIVDFFKKSIL